MVQGNKSVTEYEAEFLRLSRYARGIVATNYERCVRFEDGLQDELRRERDFAALIEKEKIAEDVKRSERQNCEKESGRNKRDFGPSIRARVPVVASRPQPCVECERPHSGECWKRTRGVLDVSPRIISLETILEGPFRCKLQVRAMCSQVKVVSNHQEAVVHLDGEMAPGRVAGNTEVRQPALVYVARRREDGDAPHVITGTFLIHNEPYTALIDIWSIHSYVVCTMSGTLGIQFKITDRDMSVISPLGQSVRVNKLFRDVPLEVQGFIFLADLMELPFGEFDLILGMDWLVKHRANLDCAAKRMALKSSEGEEVVVIGERRDYLSNVISALRAEKLVRKGCKAFLAYVSTSDVKGLSVDDVRKVKNFLDVFPEELLGLPPNCEVKFGIELLPRTALVSIAPYRMAPKELVELKAQIQQLLD
ncbi:hypothetical protein EPI10_016280 [Gossypium australe]|uniref:RVP_2 domain-containing protein n=1 Tax=Gossypium australe TaxID=47621 RepID=A0A5B6VNM7_9ROSI|nr:hypothetical protein EPI10_016280 [Gossypium australe]